MDRPAQDHHLVITNDGTADPGDITLELNIRLNGQRWTLIADEIIAAAQQLGVTVVASRLSRDPADT